jgi:hypothetical protein
MGIFYSRVIQPINTFLSLGSWMWWAIASVTGFTGAAVIAWASTTWSWYWTTFSWAGVAAAFLAAFLLLATGFLIVALAVQALRRPPSEPSVVSLPPVTDDAKLALISKARDFVSETVRKDSDQEYFREQLESDKLFSN